MADSKEHPIPVEPLRWEPGDPLAAEHELVAQMVAESLKKDLRTYGELDLDLTEAGKKILDTNPEASARIVLALVAHAAHFDALCRQVRERAAENGDLADLHSFSPQWEVVWKPRQVSAQALRRVLRRKLPLTAEHLVKIADWISDAEMLTEFYYPLKAFAKAVETHGKVGAGETVLHAALRRVAQALHNAQYKELPKLARQIEAQLGTASEEAASDAAESVVPQPPRGPDASKPAPVGSPNILVQLKEFLGIIPDPAPATIETIGFDLFPLRSDSPLREEHEVVNMMLTEVVGRQSYHSPVLKDIESGRAMLARDARGRGKMVLALAERCVNATFVQGGGLEDHRRWQSQYAVRGVFLSLLSSRPDFDREGFFDLFLYLSALDMHSWPQSAAAVGALIKFVESLPESSPLTAGERHVLYRLRCRSTRTCPFDHPSEDVAHLDKLLGDGACLALVPGEAWADAVNSELGAMAKPNREKWLGLLQHAASATGSRPSAKWLKSAKDCCKAVGTSAFSKALLRWFPLVSAPRTVRYLDSGYGRSDTEGTMHDDNATCLRGLVWMTPAVATADLVRNLGAVTVSAYKKVPGIGPRAVKVGNAGVYALSQIDDPGAVGQLALLKVKVKFGSAQKEIEKAFDAAAERSGLPRDEIEEMSVPSYGLTDVGKCEEQMGEFTARLIVTGTTSTELEWVKSDGKIQRGVPAAVKTGFKVELKELQAAAKDIQSMLPAQRERIDGLFLQQKTWPLPLWRERYLNHPLVGTLARRILWEFKTGEKSVTAIWFKGALVDVDLKPVALKDDQTTVQLWHPIGRRTEEILAWRAWLDAQQIQQPFKQAHREIYVLTDAERNTRVYSNRYAAHVLKQHQFNALCALRGWKNKLRLMVDDAYPPAVLSLPKWNLRAEFWVEGIGQDYGTDTNESGVFLRLSTDQVRFYRIDAAQRMAHAGGGGYHPDHRQAGDEPVPLDEIPPLVLSEVMRDVDMFVGVASVGNDPTWNDGGPEGRYRDYWQHYSFGDLNASAKTRKEVLQRLLPRLKISGKCSFDEKFLVVRGQLRTYKIHLGSGNILMEPNDQYLCIVPTQGEKPDEVMLPFEGDRTLSVILSKAFLLADDKKIKDPTIVSQITGR